MAIKLPDPGNGIPEQKTGNDEWTNMKIVRDNFADQSNAASRLVGTDAGHLVEMTDVGIARTGIGSVAGIPFLQNATSITDIFSKLDANKFLYFLNNGNISDSLLPVTGFSMGIGLIGGGDKVLLLVSTDGSRAGYLTRASNGSINTATFYSTKNATKDGNGFLKAASPIVDLYDDRIELNHDAERQGGITFEKLGTGNYLVKGSLGFAQEGWCIEMPKDANGNVLVAVVYEQLESNDLSIKTYDYMLNKKGRIVPDIETPLDIPEGRCINLRLHEAKEEIDEPIQ